MEVKQTGIPGLYIIQPKVFYDSRGYFFESYNKEELKNGGVDSDFIQDNQSLSAKNILRGLHFQNPPHAQGKLVSVIKGAVLDVVVDIRRSSKFYGKHFSIVLSEENKTLLWVPPGFAHGFRSLTDDTIFMYKCTQTYHKEAEGSILWNDPDLKIDWGTKDPIISDKDKNAPFFRYLQSMF